YDLIKQNANINIIITVVLMLITIYLLINDKSIVILREKQWLIRITVIFAACVSMNALNHLVNFDTSYFHHILKLLSYGLAYKYVEAKLLNSGYKDTLYNLISIQETSKVLNGNLIKKERLLKESQINIRKGEEQYETIIESIDDGIFLFEKDNLMYANKYGDKYLKDSLNEDSKDINIEDVLLILTSKKIEKEKIRNGFIGEYEVEKNNVKTNITVTLKSIKESKKILMVRDGTGIVELQKLRAEREKVKVTEVIKDEFYSNISHELRTPINVVNAALQLNNLMLNNNNLDGMIKNNNIVRQNCLRLIRTVNNFIDTNRISEGFLDINKKVYNIVDIVESVVIASNKYMLLMDNKLIFDTEYEEIYISCDKEHIERIMLNILSNSLKYGKVGGEIDVYIISSKYEVKIIVRNDAPPVPQEKIKIIFDKFTKLDSSLARPSEGSGLGLYLTKELVELNGGVIKMNSTKDVGNFFEIKIPFTFAGETWEVKQEENPQNLDEKVNIEFSDIYFN
ncbi:MAG: ATP-binding protein, partial [Clostridium sp.]